MDEKERKKYADMLMSMAIDFNLGGITWETFKSNLKMVVLTIEESEQREIHHENKI